MLRKNITKLTGHELVRLVGGSAFFFTGRISGAVLGYVTQILLARWLGSQELGFYVCAFSWCIILANISLLGLGDAVMRFVGEGLAAGDFARIRGYIRKSRQIVFGASWATALLATGFVLLLGSRISSAERLTLLLAFLCIPVFSFLRLHIRIAHAFSRFSLAALPNAFFRPLLLLLAVGVAWRFGWVDSARDVVAIHLVVMVAIAAGLAILLHKTLHGQLHDVTPIYESRRWLRTALPLLLVSMFTLYFPELNVVVMGFLLPAGDIAVFNAAFRTALLIAFGLTAVDSVILPRISRLFAEGDVSRLQQVVTRATYLKFCSGLLAVVLLILLGKTVLSMFGDEFVVGYRALLILASVQMVRVAIGPVAELLSVTGHQDRCLLVFGTALVVLVPLNCFLTTAWGIDGAAASVLLVVTGSNLWLYYLVRKHLGIDPSIFRLPRRG